MAAGITSAALTLVAGTGIAAAAGGFDGRGPGGPSDGPPGASAIAAYLGITTTELRTDLQGGQSLADVAKAQGKTVSGLEDAIVADASSQLDATRLANLKAHIDYLVSRTGPPAGHGPGGPPGASAIATYLGITASELRTDLHNGQSLADVARAQGKTVSGLEDAIVADASTHLDATRLANLKAHLDYLVSSTGPPARP
jgi:uncharacterized protein YbaP (TraB family)